METKNPAGPKGAAIASVEAVVHEVTHALEDEGNVRAVFGQPVKLDGHTLIPVAAISFSAGGGIGLGGTGMIGRALQGVADAAKKVAPGTFGGGGGGGIDLRVRPVGFISDGEHGITYTPIPFEHARAR